MVFGELVNRIRPKLKGIIYKLGYSSTLFNDEDLFQEALMYLWDHFQKGLLEDKTDSYILQGCYFNLKNYLRTASAKSREISLEKITETSLPAEMNCVSKRLQPLPPALAWLLKFH